MEQATAQTLKTSADEQRNVRNIGTYPIIALERNVLFEIAVKETRISPPLSATFCGTKLATWSSTPIFPWSRSTAC